MEERGKIVVRGTFVEDLINILVRNGYDVICTIYANDNYGKNYTECVTTVEYCKAENFPGNVRATEKIN